MTTGSFDQQDLTVIIIPSPDYQVQIIPSENDFSVSLDPSQNETVVSLAPREITAVNDLSSRVSSAQFADRATTASYADVSSGTTEYALSAEEAGKVVYVHASGSIIYTGSLAEGIFAVSETVYTVPTSSVAAALVEYVAERSGSIRVGQLMATWLGGEVKYTDISTTSIGEADDITFSVVLIGPNVQFRVNSAGIGDGGWTVQSVFKLFPRLT